MRLIVTRPEEEAWRTARALIRLGHAAIISPALDIVPDAKAAIPPRDYQAVLVTSGNAVAALAARSPSPFGRETPLLAIGDQTALAAKRAGFSAARSAGGALADLVALAAQTLTPTGGPLLYAAGADRSGDLASALGAHGFTVETVVVYRAEKRPRLAGVAEAALKENSVDGVLFYSRRSAAAFAAALAAARLAPLSERIICFCLSEAVAEAIRPAARGKILVAERPDQIALFALIERVAARAAAAGSAPDAAAMGPRSSGETI
jgi:uroporphyrinogen-III synthase